MKRIILKSIGLIASVALLSSCEDIFNPNANDELYEKDYIGAYTELYSGYMGIAARVQSVADKAIFLEGLRGDFLEPTPNATQEFWDIYYHRDVQGNFLADPAGYYSVILNANDYIKHVFDYKEKNPSAIDDARYRALVGGAIRFKVWGYLMLAKIYGEAIYVDDPLAEYEDIKKYPLRSFDQIINKCIDLIENGVNGIDGKGEVRWSVELFPGQSDGATQQEWNRICPPADALLAELYLWKGDYQKVYQNCLSVFHKGAADGKCYCINLDNYNGDWKRIFAGFSRKEHIALAFYNYNYDQKNNVIRYFSDKAPNLYYLRPTEVARERFDRQLRPTGSETGDKFRGAGVSFSQRSGTDNWLVWKYVSRQDADNTCYLNDIAVSLYRCTDIYLFHIEALAAMGCFEEALIFLNGGLETKRNADNSNFIPPYDVYPPQFYAASNPKGNQGVRGRVGAGHVGTDLLIKPNIDTDVDNRTIDSLCVEEACLESFAEARSYYAMLRMAKRWGPEVRKMWAEKIAAKYPDGAPDIKASLEADIKNWFIKYDVYK